MKKILFGFIFVIVLFVFTFLIPEIVVRLFRSQMTFADAQKLSLRCFAQDDHLPFILKKNSTCNMSDYYSEYKNPIRLNSLGYRGKEFSIDKEFNIKRILILGDSFTFGVGVNDDETYAAVTETNLHSNGFTNTEVINAGYADGFSPDAYYVYLNDKGLALQPDMIIIGLFPWNDISDLTETIWMNTNEQGLPLAVQSCCRKVEGDMYRSKKVPFKFAYPLIRESQFFQLLANTVSRTTFYKNRFSSKAVRDMYPGCVFVATCIQKLNNEEQKLYMLMQGIKTMASEKDIPFVVLIIPADYQFNSQAQSKYGSVVPLDPADTNFIGERLMKKFKDMDIPAIDLLPVLSSSASTGNYPYLAKDGHFNVAGNKIVAEVLSQYITDNLFSDNQKTSSE